MGKSPAALLFYGFPVTDASLEKPFELEKWEDAFAERAGVTTPEGRTRMFDNMPGKIVRYGLLGKYKYAFAFYRMRGANALYPGTVPEQMLEVSPHDLRRMMDFAKIMGIRWQDPCWMLTVYEEEPELPEQVPPPSDPPPLSTPSQQAGVSASPEPGESPEDPEVNASIEGEDDGPMVAPEDDVP